MFCVGERGGSGEEETEGLLVFGFFGHIPGTDDEHTVSFGVLARPLFECPFFPFVLVQTLL